MTEKSEVQNLTDPADAAEVLDAAPLAADAGQVQHGEPKKYPDDVVEDDDGESYAAAEPSSH